MPKTLEWTQPPEKTLDSSLHDVVEKLGGEVFDNPQVEDVIGIPISVLTQHAIESLGQLGVNPAEVTIDTMIQIYCMGFIVGSKHQASIQNGK